MLQFSSVTSNSAALHAYGRAELKQLLERYSMIGLIISAVIHFTLIGIYYLNQYLTREDEAPIVNVRLLRYSELGPPPSITANEQTPTVGVTPAAVKPTVGIPVPVPDVEVSPEQTIATQQELSQIHSPVNIDPGKGDIAIEQDIYIEEEPSPEAFIPVEKEPVPVKIVKPEYPDLARRAGLEGVVWVKVLVDKEGKAKKAIVIKSDAEVFNEPAIQAALQWVFTPAMMNNGPVTVWVAVPFRFQLTTKEQS
jgi:protein TonB